ncbi:transcriptional regulator, partial [Mammaliicoccus sciuri]
KFGGYQSNQTTHDVNLADLFVLFNEEKSEGRIFTGNQGSDCEISREIGHTLSQFHQREQDLLEAYYKNSTIKDVLKDILKEDSHETV